MKFTFHCGELTAKNEESITIFRYYSDQITTALSCYVRKQRGQRIILMCNMHSNYSEINSKMELLNHEIITFFKIILLKVYRVINYPPIILIELSSDIFTTQLIMILLQKN